MKKIYQSGQITLLILLLGMLGLTVGLSAVSRSVQDVKQTSQTDQGSQALAGAEAALQYGVTQYNPATVYGNCGATYLDIASSKTFPGFDNTHFLKYQICKAGTTPYGEYIGLAKDDVFQVNIPAGYSGGSTFSVSWSNTNSALEISTVSNNGGTYTLARYAYNGPSVSGNNFCGTSGSCVPLTTSCTSPSGVASSFCANSLSFAPGTPLLVRVRALYQPTNVWVSAPSLNLDSLVVQGRAETVGGTVRRVQATLAPTALPAVFDYAIYTEGSLTK